MPEFFKTRIIKFLKRPDYKPLKLKQLARAIGVNSDDYEHFKAAFDQLRKSGHTIIGPSNLVSLPGLSAGRLIGTFRSNPKGFGRGPPTSEPAPCEHLQDATGIAGISEASRVSACP